MILNRREIIFHSNDKSSDRDNNKVCNVHWIWRAKWYDIEITIKFSDFSPSKSGIIYNLEKNVRLKLFSSCYYLRILFFYLAECTKFSRVNFKFDDGTGKPKVYRNLVFDFNDYRWTCRKLWNAVLTSAPRSPRSRYLTPIVWSRGIIGSFFFLSNVLFLLIKRKKNQQW